MGKKYTSEDHDITLIIPEGAVAEDQTIHVEFNVTMYGRFILPENTQAISPVVWLCILEEDVKLKKPFRLILPHFLTGLKKERLLHNHRVGFIKAIHTNSTIKNGETKYVFKPCNSEPLFASLGNKSYVVLESDHCCFYCLQANKTRELVKDAGYCLTQIERSESQQTYKVYFIATYFLKTCIQVK